VSHDPGSLPLSAIVIGGSAGSVDALAQVLPALSADAGVVVLVVVHLPRERSSKLVEIFSRRCAMRLTEAEDKQPLEPGTVYFAPPDYHLLVDVGPALALSTDDLVHFSRPAIDPLFESAADAYRDALMGIVLSGANEDGAAGLLAVARAGGATFVQSPREASASTMPLAALRAAPDSSVLTLTELAALLGSVRDGRFQPASYRGSAP
jgi:two-component system, chemotaxis family, protein-glutamate methylesterase/glutaminase